MQTGVPVKTEANTYRLLKYYFPNSLNSADKDSFKANLVYLLSKLIPSSEKCIPCFIF